MTESPHRAEHYFFCRYGLSCGWEICQPQMRKWFGLRIWWRRADCQCRLNNKNQFTLIHLSATHLIRRYLCTDRIRYLYTDLARYHMHLTESDPRAVTYTLHRRVVYRLQRRYRRLVKRTSPRLQHTPLEENNQCRTRNMPNHRSSRLHTLGCTGSTSRPLLSTALRTHHPHSPPLS